MEDIEIMIYILLDTIKDEITDLYGREVLHFGFKRG